MIHHKKSMWICIEIKIPFHEMHYNDEIRNLNLEILISAEISSRAIKERSQYRTEQERSRVNLCSYYELNIWVLVF